MSFALRLAPALIAALILAVGPAHAKPRAGKAGASAPKAAKAAEATGTLMLVESWPVETTLDHPGIPDASDVWVALFDGAKSSVDLGEFYVATEPGSRLELVLAALTRAADRGVKVRLAADAKFAKTYPETLASLDAHAQIEVRKLDLEPSTGGVLHAKYFIVDGRVAYVGSQNFDWRSLSHVQELGFTVDEPRVVDVYERVFAIDWAVAGGASVVDALAAAPVVDPLVEGASVNVGVGTALVTPVASPTGLLGDERLWDLPYLLGAIGGARTRIRLQALSYERVGYDKIEWTALDEALRAAAGRGVAVELIVADWSKSGDKLKSVQGLMGVPGITVKFASIPEASTGFVSFARVVHSKYITVDGAWSWIGTSNLSRDYFYGSRNVGIVTRGAPLATQLDAYFDTLWTSSYVEVVDPLRADYSPPRRK
ncbi:MAG: phospholipase D-like domain-containing protein [Pseudomonadota bacterium]|nr:phospholipase D-like domain-containing protein [Pseudomonadota bacterium]